jgi:hypothetical protein
MGVESHTEAPDATVASTEAVVEQINIFINNTHYRAPKPVWARSAPKLGF